MPSRKEKIKSILVDIRFWIIVAFLGRLYGITFPPLEVLHNWRQTNVLMVARNFFEVDPNIFFPRIDNAGDLTGITGMEFPLLNYLIYLVSLIFGYDHWYGRLINLIVSSFGIYYFFKLINKYFNKQMAFYSAILLLFSIWFIYSRKIMPDTFSVSLVIMSMYFGSSYLENKNRIWDLLVYFLLALVGILSKLPAGYLIILLAPLIWDKQIHFKNKIAFIIASLVVLIPVCFWYFIWCPYLVEKYDFWYFFMGKSFGVGAVEIFNYLPETFAKFYESAMHYSGFFIFLLGIFFAFKKRNERLLLLCFYALFFFSLIIIKAGWTFAHHGYYIIPFVPVMALVGGYGLDQIRNKKIIVLLLVTMALEGVLNHLSDFRIKDKNEALLCLEGDLDKISDRDDLIIINSGKYPTPLYFSHHKGWIEYNEDIADTSYMTELKDDGLKYIVVLKRTFGENIDLDYKEVMNNKNYKIYKVN